MVETVSPQQTQLLTREEIIDLLDAKDIPWRTWHTMKAARTLDALVKYHREGQVFFREDSQPGLIIDVHVIVMRVHHRVDTKWLELFEAVQIFANGDRLERGDCFDGLGETRNRGETIHRGAVRCLEEELKFFDPSTYTLSDCLGVEHRAPCPSEKWPGVTAAYHRYIHECVISRAIFNPDGYVEPEEDGRLIYFKWRPLQQRELPL